MKNLCLLALSCFVVLAVVQSAHAIPAFNKEFENKYVKKESTNDSEKALAAAVAKVKCNVCHMGKTKKVRNEYGKALDELLDKKTDIKDIPKIQAALEKVAGMKSNPNDPSSPTFGELLEQGKLPGGEESAAPAASDGE
ncbi:MAG: hypothetical protein HY288_09465 [Planctomycetia bacterium]|nr:hypothetical protein [Planctomycetia bacterium]